ncbi:MAG TPA: CBS domain-containing protein [Stellaceae bacterium]|nr:CBS domain-containing protein [Stellaceae bacterium]
MKVSDVMTRGVISLAPGDTVLKAAHLMTQYGVSGFPVLDCGKLVGIITQGDFLHRAELGTEPSRAHTKGLSAGQLAAKYVHAHGRKVGEVMTRDVLTVNADSSLEEAVELMERHGVKRLPVVKGDGVIGLINRVNVLHAFIVAAHQTGETSANDDEIRCALAATLDAEPWAPRGALDIVVDHGRVELRGVITDERQRLALRVAAENTRGVKGITDNLELRHVAAS